MEITLSKTNFLKGEKGIITILYSGTEQYTQIQIDFFETGTINPKPKLGFGITPRLKGNDIYEVDLDTKDLNYEIYEIKLVRLHTMKGEELSTDRKDFVGGRDFERLFSKLLQKVKLLKKKRK